MRHIGEDLGWQPCRQEEFRHKRLRGRRSGQPLRLAKDFTPFLNSRDISALCFYSDNFGRKEFEVPTMPLPPFRRKLLMCQDNRVTLGPHGEIPDEARLKIHFRFHASTLPQPAAERKRNTCWSRL